MSLIYNYIEDDYVDFIAGLRNEVRDRDRSSHGLPVLPSRVDLSSIDVALRGSNSHKGTLRIRRFDLRLLEYRDPNGNVIDIGELGLYAQDGSRLEDSELDGLLVGSSNFVKAINFVANYKDNGDFRIVGGDDYLKSCLTLVCVVICEATKLEILCKLFDRVFKSGDEISLCVWMTKLMDNWEDMSKELLDTESHFENDPNCDYFLPNHENAWYDDERWVIGVTCQDVVKCVGILRNSPPLDSMSVDFCKGARLLQIYSVSVYLNGGGCRSVYGTVTVSNAFDTYSFYDRDQPHHELIESGGTLSLKDPQCSISCSRHIHISLNLMEAGDGKNVSKGTVIYGVLRDDKFNDSLLSAMVRGDNGYAVLHYSVFDQSIPAIVEATFLVEDSGDGGETSLVHDNHICVCGSLVARFGDKLSCVTDYEKKYYQTTLYNKPATGNGNDLAECTFQNGGCGRGEAVELGAPIKLLRPVVNVPVTCPLIIEANFRSCDGEPIAVGFNSWVPAAGESLTTTMASENKNTFVVQPCSRSKKSVVLQAFGGFGLCRSLL